MARGRGRARVEFSGAARHFQRLFDDLVQASDQAYGPYRIISAEVHPTLGVIYRYVRPPGESHVNLFPVPAPDPAPGRWLLLLCASMVWAGRAFDHHDRARRSRGELRTAAKMLQVPGFLVLPNAARVRAAHPKASRLPSR